MAASTGASCSKACWKQPEAIREADMTDLTLDKDARTRLASEIKHYLETDLDIDIGNMDAELLIDFLTPSLGARFYNLGLKDAQALLARKVDDINDEVYALEKPVQDRG